MGENKGGSIQINASDSVSISGVNPEQRNLISGLITSSEENATGQSGDISVNTARLIVSDGAVVSARSRSAGAGGSINVDTNTLELTGGGQLVTSAFNDNNAGNITINASNVQISGSNSTYNMQIGLFGERLIDNDSPNSGLFARVRGVGNATANGGNINVTARSIRLDKQGTISTDTTLGNGGSITLNVRDILQLRNHSKISASAGTVGAAGNGGNITINTPSGFIVSVPNENSDITANGFKGSGGRVTINATGIYGLTVLSREDLARLLKTNDLTQIDFQRLPSSITAISQTNPNLNGQVNLNTPEVDPSRGLVNLPTITEVAPRLVDSSCAAVGDGTNGNTFVVTGRGGLPPSPDEPLSSDVVWSDTRLPATIQQQYRSQKPNQPHLKQKTVEIVPATGWVLNDKGEVILVSYVPNTTSIRLGSTPATCFGQ